MPFLIKLVQCMLDYSHLLFGFQFVTGKREMMSVCVCERRFFVVMGVLRERKQTSIELVVHVYCVYIVCSAHIAY